MRLAGRTRKTTMLVLLLAAITTGGIALDYVRPLLEVSGGPVYWILVALFIWGFCIGLSHAHGIFRGRRWVGLVLIGAGLIAVVACVLALTHLSLAGNRRWVLTSSAVSPPLWFSAAAITLFVPTTLRPRGASRGSSTG